MGLVIFKIIFIILTIRILFLIGANLLVVFYNKASEDIVKVILENPKEYVRNEHMCKFFYDIFWLCLFIKILIAAFSGNISFTT